MSATDPDYTWRECAGDRRLRTPFWRAADARRRADRRDLLARTVGAAVHRQADRARHDLRRSGGDRDRERAAVRGGAGAHARAHGITRTADRDSGRAKVDQPLANSICSRCSIQSSASRRRGSARPMAPALASATATSSRARGIDGLTAPKRVASVREPSRSVSDRGSVTGRAVARTAIVHIPDILDDSDYTFREGPGRLASAATCRCR